MKNSFRTLSFAAAVTLTSLGLTVANGITNPTPAEAGILSSIGDAASSVGRGIKKGYKKLTTSRVGGEGRANRLPRRPASTETRPPIVSPSRVTQVRDHRAPTRPPVVRRTL